MGAYTPGASERAGVDTGGGEGMSQIETKRPLQEAFQEHQLMTPKECFDALGWTYVETEGDFTDICCCGEKVTFSGWIGSEHAHCAKCHKGMQDVTGVLPSGNGTVTTVDFDRFEIPEDGRVWIPVNVWGL